MELTDIMAGEKWGEFAKSIYYKFGLNGAVYDSNYIKVIPIMNN
jgi:hypothetical protein